MAIAESATEEDQARYIDAVSDPTAAVLALPRKPTQQFVSAVGPAYAVFIEGSRTSNAPSADVLAAVASAMDLSTDDNGTIEFVFDREAIRARTER